MSDFNPTAPRGFRPGGKGPTSLHLADGGGLPVDPLLERLKSNLSSGKLTMRGAALMGDIQGRSAVNETNRYGIDTQATTAANTNATNRYGIDTQAATAANTNKTNLYGIDTQAATAANTNKTNLYGIDTQAASSKYNSDNQVLASKYGADTQAATSKYNSDNSLTASQYGADVGFKSNMYQTDAKNDTASFYGKNDTPNLFSISSVPNLSAGYGASPTGGGGYGQSSNYGADFNANYGAQPKDKTQLGFKHGGSMRPGQSGTVPGTGKGDKINAKYEPGEFVVSNAMLEKNPGLREQLHSLRADALADKGMTPEQADAKAVNAKGEIRAEDAVQLERTSYPGLYPYNMPSKNIYAGAGLPSDAPENTPLPGSITGGGAPSTRVVAALPALAAPIPPTGYESNYARDLKNARAQAEALALAPRASIDSSGDRAAYLAANDAANAAKPSYFSQSTPTSNLAQQSANERASTALQQSHSGPVGASSSASAMSPRASAAGAGRGTVNQTPADTAAAQASQPAAPANPNQINVARQPNGTMSFSGGPNIGKDGGDISYAGPTGFKPSGFGVSTPGSEGDGRRTMEMNNRLASEMRADRMAQDAAAAANAPPMLVSQFERRNAEVSANSRYDGPSRQIALKQLAAMDAQDAQSQKGAIDRQQRYADGLATQAANAPVVALKQREAAIAEQKQSGDMTVQGFQIRGLQQIEALRAAYDKADAKDKPALAEQLRVLMGQAKPDQYTVAAGGQQVDERGMVYKTPDRVFNKGTGAFVEQGATAAPAAAIPSRAAAMLKSNPKMAADFDAKYGAGAAARTMEQK